MTSEDTRPRPTLRTIAQETGFAVTTVSRALADDPMIARRTRETIGKAAEALGYVPDRAAQRLRTGRTNVIALVLDPHSEILDFSGSMISGIAEVVHDTRYHLTLTQYQLGEDPMRPIRNIVRNRLADGIIFARTLPQDPRVGYLLEAGFPFVTHGRTELGAHAWLDHDNAAYSRLAVARLVAKGRRRILLIPPSPLYTFHSHMVAGFQAAIAEAGVTGMTSDGVDLNSPPNVLSARIAELLARPDAPDGWICPGEIPAVATSAALQDAGRVIGQDVDIVAKRTSTVFDLFRPRIDTIHEDIPAAGRGMAQALLAQIAGTDAKSLQHLQTPEPDF